MCIYEHSIIIINFKSQMGWDQTVLHLYNGRCAMHVILSAGVSVTQVCHEVCRVDCSSAIVTQ